jgi:hypothetical protein
MVSSGLPPSNVAFRGQGWRNAASLCKRGHLHPDGRRPDRFIRRPADRGSGSQRKLPENAHRAARPPRSSRLPLRSASSGLLRLVRSVQRVGAVRCLAGRHAAAMRARALALPDRGAPRARLPPRDLCTQTTRWSGRAAVGTRRPHARSIGTWSCRRLCSGGVGTSG